MVEVTDVVRTAVEWSRMESAKFKPTFLREYLNGRIIFLHSKWRLSRPRFRPHGKERNRRPGFKCFRLLREAIFERALVMWFEARGIGRRC
jgi:hypothetical protein